MLRTVHFRAASIDVAEFKCKAYSDGVAADAFAAHHFNACYEIRPHGVCQKTKFLAYLIFGVIP